MTSILVTGANGFVGSALCATLEAAGLRVRRAVRTSNRPGDIAVGSIGAETDWGTALADSGVVIHLAARVHVMQDDSPDALAAYREVNATGTRRLAEQAALNGVRRFIYLSSIKVNGDATVPGRPYGPSDEPRPEDPYGLSKLEAERAIAEVASRRGMEFVVIRPPLIYGPGVRANFRSMMLLVRRGMPLPLGCVTGNRRSLLSLGNLTDLLLNCVGNPMAANRTFLASDGEDLSTVELLRRLGVAMGRPARLVPVPVPFLELGARLFRRPDLARRLLGSLQVDISETRRVLGWNPPVSVGEGLSRAVAPFLD